ncbi:MAG TPA: FtsX-like permease family protein, partial [Candidatus Synoicihabitans sp.]|nr:FtsX-like permease family protein [Candidatus Synoicihabitans sp.]
TEAQGAAFIEAFSARLAADFPAENGKSRWRVESLLSATTNQNARGVISMLFGLSACVLLIACTNLANLLLARTVSRGHELAVRAALGASRGRLLRLLGTESLLLAVAGGAGALLVATWSGEWLSTQSVASGGEPLEFPLDWRVLGFALVASLITALGFGALPALVTVRVDVNDAMKRGARGATSTRAHRWFHHGLVGAQCAMAMILLCSAGYFLRGARVMLNQHFGWDPEHVVVADLQLPPAKYPSDQDIAAFHQRMIERLESIPGVAAASVNHVLPLYGMAGPRDYAIEGVGEAGKTAAKYNGVTPSYFAATGTRLLRGRSFAATDTAAAPKVAIINESMAEALFGDEDPVGRRLVHLKGEPGGWSEIVGVAADVRYVTMFQRTVPFQVYHPFFQEPRPHVSLAVRAEGVAPDALLEPIRRAVAELDPDLPLRDLMPASIRIKRAGTEYSMLSKMLGVFAGLGLGLAVLGLAAVMARNVAQRTHEIGIRIAVGASAPAIMRMILASGVRVVLAGAAVGAAGGWAVSRVIVKVMPGVETYAGGVLASAAGLLVGAALLAGYAPARRATRVDPIQALRAE